MSVLQRSPNRRAAGKSCSPWPQAYSCCLRCGSLPTGHRMSPHQMPGSRQTSSLFPPTYRVASPACRSVKAIPSSKGMFSIRSMTEKRPSFWRNTKPRRTGCGPRLPVKRHAPASRLPRREARWRRGGRERSRQWPQSKQPNQISKRRSASMSAPKDCSNAD